MERTDSPPNRWWREIQVLWLLVLVAGIYFSRITDLNLLGEETRRAQVAREMIWTGDWLVPRQQGEIYLSRPPLGSWVIALAAEWRGRLDAVAVRLPTLLAVLLTTLLIYAYSRNFLSRAGAFLAAVGYATMAQVLQLGRVAESEGLFTFLISASLLVWHGGYRRRWPAWFVWSAGYILAALAGLTKGPQGIAYFVGPVWAYLILWERNGRELVRPAHIIGLVAGATTIALWQVPYMMATSLAAGKAIWFAQASNRFDHADLSIIAGHLLLFPLEIIACTLPWSLAFVQFLNRNFWRSLDGVRSEVWFLLIALAVTFPTVWFAPHARGRYFMPLYPVIAVLCGLILERCAQARPLTWMNRGWQQFILGFTAAATVGGVVVCVLAFLPESHANHFAISPLLAVCFLFLVLGVGAWMLTHVRSGHARDIQIATGCLAVVLGMIYTGIIVSSQSERQPPVEDLLAEVHQELPEDKTLVSFGRVTHAFAYYYGEFIPQTPWPASVSEPVPEYFCCLKADLAAHPLPFAWEAIAEMSFEDDEVPSPRSYVIVARRLPEVASAPGEEIPRR